MNLSCYLRVGVKRQLCMWVWGLENVNSKGIGGEEFEVLYVSDIF